MKKPNWKLWIKDKRECREWLNHYLNRGILRKTEDESKLYLNKTKHNLQFANWLTEKHKKEIPEFFGEEIFYDWIINIYYYAIYHASLALISKEKYNSKSHSATLCFLIYHHYHTQKALAKEDVELLACSLDKEDIETIGSSKELREKACYDVHKLFEQQLSQNIRKTTIQFVDKIRSLIEK